MEWWYAKNGEQTGPVSEGKLLEFLKNHELPVDTLVWNETLTEWTPATQFSTFRVDQTDWPPRPTVPGAIFVFAVMAVTAALLVPQLMGRRPMSRRPLDTVKSVDEHVIAGEYRGSLAGHIVTEEQQPVPGVAVELIQIGDTPWDGKKIADVMPLRECPKQQTVTDAQGAWRFDDLPVGHYGIKAESDAGLATDDMPMRIVPKSDGPDSFAAKSVMRGRDMSPELRPAEPLAGRIVAPDGQPAAGVEIFPYSQGAGAASVSTAEAYILGQKCGNDGTFSFPKLKKGLWQFAVSVNGGESVLTDWFTTGDRNVEICLGEARQGQTPEIVAKTLNGKLFRLSGLRGKYVLLDFWATWCRPCREETPSIKAAYAAFKNDSRLVMVGLSLDNEAGAPRKYVEENEMGWTQVFLGNWQQARIPAELKVDAIPQIMLLNPDGACIARDLRGPAILEKVRDALK